MNEPFLIPVIFEGKEQEFKARFERWGYYTHRISVLINEMIIVFEPNEEGGYRALCLKDNSPAPTELLSVLANKLGKLINK